eukprot:Skav231047  [mRNA]  locus=scaffold446:279012:285267:+ [translate_table: standard]
MNRNILEVLGIVGKKEKKGSSNYQIEGEVTTTNKEHVADLLAVAKKAWQPGPSSGLGQVTRVVIVPGYGVAVSKAQYALAELVEMLSKMLGHDAAEIPLGTWNGCDVKIAIHPVAGRMPGQLNVLLAEAGVPYDQAGRICGKMSCVNSLAEEDPATGRPLAGEGAAASQGRLACEEVHCGEAISRSALDERSAVGYAALDNPVFYKDFRNVGCQASVF